LDALFRGCGSDRSVRLATLNRGGNATTFQRFGLTDER
jgi:hypothetical protein